MNIGICVHFTNQWLPLIEITLPILHKYCDKQDYDLSVIESPQYSRYDGTHKILQASESLIFKDVLMVMDADTLVMNHTIKIEDLIDDEYDVFITRDYNGINAGVFIIKNSEWSFDFLKYLLNEIGKPDIHCEQDAINQYIKQHGSDNIKFLAQRTINSYLYELYPEIKEHEKGELNKESLVLHVPGLPLDKKIEVLKSQIKNIIYE